MDTKCSCTLILITLAFYHSEHYYRNTVLVSCHLESLKKTNNKQNTELHHETLKKTLRCVTHCKTLTRGSNRC